MRMDVAEKRARASHSRPPIRSIGMAIDRAIELDEPPETGPLARLLSVGLDEAQRFWLAHEAFLALSEDGQLDFYQEHRDLLTPYAGEMENDILCWIDFELRRFSTRGRRAMLAAVWRRTSLRDRADFQARICGAPERRAA